MARIRLSENGRQSCASQYHGSTLMSYVIVALLAFIAGIQLGISRASCPRSPRYITPCARPDSHGIDAGQTWRPAESPSGIVDDRQQLGFADGNRAGRSRGETPSALLILDDLRSALESMQTSYFELWLGLWPDAIDWTAAVLGTLLSASLSSLARAADHLGRTTRATSGSRWDLSSVQLENEMDRYFAHSIGFYFGEDAFAVRLQAYDDMLWVVLGWLESIKYIRQRGTARGSDTQLPTTMDVGELGSPTSSSAWFGRQFVPVFAHRARVFYDLAKQGYDHSLCGGGMLWNPHLLPYKNAITNELFISASVGMYLYFPGDDNSSPFAGPNDLCLEGPCPRRHAESVEGHAHAGHIENTPYNVNHLRGAVEGYNWLKNSNMTNSQGLYVDGFHIKDYGVNGTIGTGRCDIRNEMVYTYNQGVLLSGLRGLWEGTGQRTYLEDGHDLVRSVINATGWDPSTEPHLQPEWPGRWKWSGLGRAGILEELCDAAGTCNQDAQTFKGIFFHHLTLFCEPLPRQAAKPGSTFAADSDTAFLHHSSCASYRDWVVRNAKAALRTRNGRGEFGMWWTCGVPDEHPAGLAGRNTESVREERTSAGAGGVVKEANRRRSPAAASRTDPAQTPWLRAGPAQLPEPGDPNDRFRGRTVETQGGGLAVVRAMYEFTKLGLDR